MVIYLQIFQAMSVSTVTDVVHDPQLLSTDTSQGAAVATTMLVAEIVMIAGRGESSHRQPTLIATSLDRTAAPLHR